MNIFTKRKWSPYKHVAFVEDFRAGIRVYEILKRQDYNTDLTQYKLVYVKNCVHGLVHKLNSIQDKKIIK